jgi:glyoxylase-like metal-dependent hydrolase (beta-lactamase superfamily II)
MELHSISGGFFKLDGGAMFGVVPKSIWNKLNPSDDQNLCLWALRCLLISDGNRLILIDTGLGNKQNERFFSHYQPTAFDALETNLKKRGITSHDITDVVLTHLHFDHCGGAVTLNKTNGHFEPTFKNARYWTHSHHLSHALNSNQREKASFLNENIVPLSSNGLFQFLDKDDFGFPQVSFIYVDGHTEKMALPLIQYKDKKILYCADLIPSAAHLPVNFVMSYDIRPLQTMIEKQDILDMAHRNRYVLFFEHDPINEACTIKVNAKGKFEAEDIFLISNW